MKRLMIGAVSVIFFLGLNSSVAFAHPPGQSINIPCSVTLGNGSYSEQYGSLYMALSSPISEKLRKVHKLDETSEGTHRWRIRAQIPLSKGGVATFISTVAYSVRRNGRIRAETGSNITLISEGTKFENRAAFEDKVKSMKGNFGPFPSVKCELLK